MHANPVSRVVGAVTAAVILCMLASASALANGDKLQAFLNYTRTARYQAVVTKDISVPMRDGGTLSCDLYRPGTTTSTPAPGRFPGVVYQYHNYGSNRTGSDVAQDQFLAQEGYNSLECSVRGVGGSPGTFNIFSAQEVRDGYDIVEWLARQPWSNGKIAMVGYSYGACTAYLTAGLRPPHLVTIVPQASWEDLYLDIAHLGGVQGMDVRAYLLGLILSLNTTGTPAQQLPGLEQQSIAADQAWGNHLLYDPFWNQYKINFAAIKASRIPILGFGGWYDIFQRGMPANYERLPAQTWLVMQNVSHVEVANPTFYGHSNGPTLAWLDHWLKGLRGAPMPPTHVSSYEMPSSGGHGWTSFDSWPPPAARPTELHLDSDGTLGASAGPPGMTSYNVNPYDGMPNYWNLGDRPDTAPVIAWNTAQEAVRAHWSTPALAHDLVLAGPIQARVKAAFSATDGVLVARLSDIDQNGEATLASTGWAQASLPPPYTRSVTVTPGQMRDYQIEIWPTDWRFLAGHKLQLSISSGDVPRIMPVAPRGTVTVSTGDGGSTLTLPALGAVTPAQSSPTGTGNQTLVHLGAP